VLANSVDITDLLAAAQIAITDCGLIPSSQGHAIYRVSGPDGDFIIRVASDAAHLRALRREVRLLAGLREWVTLRIPDTCIVDAGTPFAVHCHIPGDPLTTGLYEELSPALRERLVADLATFFRETHAVPLELASSWLGEPYGGKGVAAVVHGKPAWFRPDDVVALRQLLEPILDESETEIFERTVGEYEMLGAHPDFMVFGHGDLHGYNIAIGEDALGPRLVGVFDLGCTSILDIHEDFFRLSLVSEDLLNRVLAAYRTLPGPERKISRDRIVVYYRAFLFYLMCEASGETLANLRRLLQKHIALPE